MALRFAAILSGIIGFLAAPAWAEAPPVPIEETVPVSALGYDVLQPGEIRAPKLGFVTQTAMVLSSNNAAKTEDEIAILAEANRLFKAGEGQAGVDYLLANMDRSPHGTAELRLANFYITKGDGGLTVPPDDAYLWLARAAEKAPFIWFHVGNGHYKGYWGAEADPQKAAHIWSRSVPLGCQECAEAMGDFWEGSRKGVEVSMADAYVYTIFAVDMGEEYTLWNRLTKILERLPRNPTGVLAEAVDLKNQTLSYAGSLKFNYGGLAKATYTKYRTGLVHEEVWIVDEHIESGDYGAAFNILGNLSGGSGRYMADQLNELFLTAEQTSPGFFEVGHVNYARASALSGGDISHAMAVGETFFTGYDVKHTYGSDETVRFSGKEAGMQMFEAAERTGYYDARIIAHLADEFDAYSITQKNKAWSACYDRWQSNNRLKTQTTLGNGRKIRNMAFVEACETQFLDYYHAVGPEDQQQMRTWFLNPYREWAAALDKQNRDWEEKFQKAQQRKWARRNSNNTPSASEPLPSPGSDAALSSARGWSNYRAVCSASGGTAHICK